MKKLFITCAVIIILLFSGCSQRTPRHEIQYSNNGQDSIVYVHYYDDNSNQWVDRYMEYVIFMNLYNMGGYNSIYGYYRTNPYNPYIYSRYRNYSYNYSPSYYHSRGYTRSGNTWVSPRNSSSRSFNNSSSRPSGGFSSRPANSSSRPSGFSSRPSSSSSRGTSSRSYSSGSSSRGSSSRSSSSHSSGHR